MDEKEAEKIIRDTDKERGQYFKEFLGIDWLDPANYDICLSTDVLSIETAVGIIKESISLP